MSLVGNLPLSGREETVHGFLKVIAILCLMPIGAPLVAITAIRRLRRAEATPVRPDDERR
ncbi:MAG TPA: hypothetical protein VJV74_06400 [Terriglobia bacterium]|nr:hypothetical protein [Terriglobia bacterium]